jgi:hypothetical protein
VTEIKLHANDIIKAVLPKQGMNASLPHTKEQYNVVRTSYTIPPKMTFFSQGLGKGYFSS